MVSFSADFNHTPRRLRVVFLDIDGVLNSSKFWQDISAETGSDAVTWTVQDIDPRAVALLNELAPAETTRIVVSSIWRRQGLRPVRELLERAGVQARVIGVTPDFHEDYARGREIASWLRDNGDLFGVFGGPAYVVLDDDFDAGIGHGTRFVKTDVAVGLTRAAVDQALAMFAHQEKEPE